MWGMTRRRRMERDLLQASGRVAEAVDRLKQEAALLAVEQRELQSEVCDLMRLLIERAGEVSPSVDAVLLVAEASLEASAPPLAG